MRVVRYSVAASLDGYIAGPNGEFDWIPRDPEIDFAAMFADVDTMLVGRGTYEVMQRQGDGDTIGAMRVIVCSHTLRQEDHPTVTITSDAVATVKALRDEPGKVIWLMGGGELFRELLEAGQVDTVDVAVVPVLLGRGIPLLPATDVRTTLELTDHRVFQKTGTTRLRYRVVRHPAARRSRESSRGVKAMRSH